MFLCLHLCSLVEKKVSKREADGNNQESVDSSNQEKTGGKEEGGEKKTPEGQKKEPQTDEKPNPVGETKKVEETTFLVSWVVLCLDICAVFS